MEHNDPGSVQPVKDAAGRFDDLAVRRVREFPHQGTAFRVLLELLNMGKHATDECLCGIRFVEGDEVGDSIQIA